MMDILTWKSIRVPAATSNSMAAPRWTKRNLSTSTLASLNTSSNSMSSYPLRPSPASSASEHFSHSSGDLLQVDSAPSHIEPLRYNSRAESSEDDLRKDSGRGRRRKMSRPGTKRGKGSSMRIGTNGPRRTQSEVSLVLSPEEAIRVIDEIREKAAKDTARAMDHTTETSIHPTRQRSLFTPGLATRNPNDPFRTQGQYEARRTGQPIDQPPATAPLYRPNPFVNRDYLPPQIPSHEPRFNALGLVDGQDPLSRASTPLEYDYGRLGAGLRIVNGVASPDPSIGRPSPRPGHKKSLTTAYGGYLDNRTRGHTRLNPYDQPVDYIPGYKTPLQSRLYEISNASYPSDRQGMQEMHVAPGGRVPRHSPSGSTDSHSGHLAQEYISDIKSPPFAPDLNKPLPIPPPPSAGTTPVVQQVESPGEDLQAMARTNSDRSDLSYRWREPLSEDLVSRQDSLFDETITLLDSIGRSDPDFRRPRGTTTTTTTSTSFSSSAAPSMARHKRYTSNPPVPLSLSKNGGTQTVTLTAPTISVTHTRASPRNAKPVQMTPTQTSMQSTTTAHSMPVTKNWQRHENGHQYFGSLADHTGMVQIPMSRHDDSGYGSSLSQSSSETSQLQRTGHSRTASNFETSSRRPSLTVRPPLPGGSIATGISPKISSAFSDSSDDMTTTLASLRGVVAGNQKRRTKKPEKVEKNEKVGKNPRPTSMPPPAVRIPVQGQKLNHSGFIPPIPQDMANRHAQRGKDFPPLAETVPPVQKVVRDSNTTATPPPLPPKSNHRTSKGAFFGRLLKIGSNTAQAPEPEITTAPVQRNEPAGFHGSSPYDMPSSATRGRRKSQGAWDTVHPALRPTPHLEERVDAWVSHVPQTAPPSQHNFEGRKTYNDAIYGEYYHDYQQQRNNLEPPSRRSAGLRKPASSDDWSSWQYTLPEPHSSYRRPPHRRRLSEHPYKSFIPLPTGQNNNKDRLRPGQYYPAARSSGSLAVGRKEGVARTWGY